jgi:hypothetical protein
MLAIVDAVILVADATEYLHLREINSKIQETMIDYSLVHVYRAFTRAQGYCWAARGFNHDTYTGCDGDKTERLDELILKTQGDKFDEITVKKFHEFLCLHDNIGCHDYTPTGAVWLEKQLNVVPYAMTEMWGMESVTG